jgi:hypothetical protein
MRGQVPSHAAGLAATAAEITAILGFQKKQIEPPRHKDTKHKKAVY